jgi:hypothetical protein
VYSCFFEQGQVEKDLLAAFHSNRGHTYYIQVQNNIKIANMTCNITKMTPKHMEEKSSSPSPPHLRALLHILASNSVVGNAPLGTVTAGVARTKQKKGLRNGILPGG